MKVLLFGSAGFVGRNMVHKLQDESAEFIATDMMKSPFGNEVNYSMVDILNYDDVKKVVDDVDVILHLAASPLLASIKDPRLNMKINVEGTLNILDAARDSGVNKIVFSSASSVVGEVRFNPVTEDHPCFPKTPYAAAKKACEDYLRLYYDLFGLNYMIFRFFNVYGPWQYPVSGALIPLIYEKLTSKAPVTIYGDGSAARDFIHINDVADFIIESVRRDVKNELVNMGTGKPTSIMDLVKLSSEILNTKAILDYKPKRPGEIDNFVADTGKLESIFARKPNISIEDGLGNIFSWLDKHVK